MTFTQEYRLDVYLTACGYAIPMFQKMSDTFNERHDPRQSMERDEKAPLFAMFRNQYNQAEAEEAIASTLCAHFEEPIKAQIRNIIGSKMVGLMKGSDQCFSSKMALKVKILTDLNQYDNFEYYMHYVLNVKESLEFWIRYYTIKYCDERPKQGQSQSQSTRLQQAIIEEVTRLKDEIQKKITGLNRSSVQKWIEAFARDEDIRSELGVNLDAKKILVGYDSGEGSENVSHLEYLMEQIKIGLQDLEKNLHLLYSCVGCEREMEYWKDKPHDLLQSLFGCTEQCPFCGEQCDLLDPNHIENDRNHTVSIHRSKCLMGYRNTNTNVMVVDFCPASVSGKEKGSFRNSETNWEYHLYEDYQKIYPKWSIPPDVTSDDSMYWKRFVGKYMKQIANKFNAEPSTVPDSCNWSELEWKEVEKNMRHQYNL